MNYLKKIFSLLDNYEKKKIFFLLLVVFFSMLIEVLGIALIIPLLNIILNKDLVTIWLDKNLPFAVQNFSYEQILYSIIILIFFVYLFKNILSIYFIWIQNKFTNNVQVRLANTLLKKYLYLPYENYLDKNNSILLRNIEEVRTFQGVLLRLTLAISEIIIFLGIITLLFIYNFKISIFIFLFFLISSSIILKILMPLIKKLGDLRLLHAKKTTKHLLEALSAFKEIRIYGRLNYFFKKFYENNSRTMASNLRYNLFDNFPRILLELLFISVLLSTIFLMVYSNSDFSKIITLLGLYSVASFRIMPSLNRIIQSLQNLRFMMPVVDMLYQDIIKEKSDILEISSINSQNKENNEDDSNSLIFFNDKICFKNVNFNYQNSNSKIINNLSLEIKKNDIIGIIGESGSGKSTLINLLLCLLQPSSGSIEIDGVDIQKNIKAWRKLIGYVPQNIFITDDTLKKNIALGIDEDQISEKQVNQSLEFSKLNKYVIKKKEGIESTIGDKGSKISGGELQRLGLARAFYNNPQVLILDEFTSSLDFKTEEEILNEIEKLKNKITIILITHRKSTLKVCNKVLKLEKGTIIKKD